MKLFGLKIGTTKSSELRITSADREWVEVNFQWLVKVFGYPRADQFSLAEKHFPKTFHSKEIRIEDLLSDCCNHLGLDNDRFSYSVHEDIRDSGNMPYGSEERPTDCYIEYDEQTGKYLVVLAKSILKHPKWLIQSICYELTKARLIESKVEYGTGPDTSLFLYLAATYFGYGVIIGQNLTDIGMTADPLWETRWSYIADIPYPIMAYALAVFSRLKNNLDPAWKQELPSEIRTEFSLALEYINRSDNELFDARRIDNAFNAAKLFELADQLYQSGEISKAISTLQKIAFLSDDDMMKADVCNNIGYYKLRLGQYRSSISDFHKALEFAPDYGYANDNLGFALIMTGDLEKGKEFLERAIRTENNNQAYSYRNMALYFQKKGDRKSAEDNFQKAFSMESPVDLLNYFYGQFLIENGDKKKGLEYIRISADNREIEGIELLKKME